MNEVIRFLLKIIMWILIIGFGCNFIMQWISYSFYKNAKPMKRVNVEPEFIQYSEILTGYGHNINSQQDTIILFFGGSNYIAYNSVACYSDEFDEMFFSADYYGSQKSKGKMNLASMKKTALDLYDYVKIKYPDKKIVSMGHSYGAGMAAYLASERPCEKLILLAAYEDVSDLYNKIIPIFQGPGKIFISNNITVKEYAKKVTCDTYVIGSHSDKTLSDGLQYKVGALFIHSKVKIFEHVEHEFYLKDKECIEYIKSILV